MFNISWQFILMGLPAIVCALTVHELSHGLAAYWLGDTTAKRDGRLSLNPLRHIDPVGLLVLIIARIGWAKPVMVNPHNLKNPKQDMAIIAFAGPLSNFLFGLVVALLYPLLYLSGIGGGVFVYLNAFFENLIVYNIVLGVFNLFPIPPLDGSKVFSIFLRDSDYFMFINFRYGFFILLALVLTGITWRIIEPLMMAIWRGYFQLVDMVYFFL
jgi:Zn-dependent protease